MSAKKKPLGEKYVELTAWVKPEHKVKVKARAKKNKITESNIIRDLIETL